MDEFVRKKLTKWGFSDWIERFKDEGIDKDSFQCLEDQDINDLVTKVGPRAKIRRLMKHEQEPEEAADCVPTGPSTSYSNGREENTLSNVKEIMKLVKDKLEKENKTTFNDFLKTKIDELDVNKRELVGVFGRTGAGKSSLINSIIGEFDLLPSGSVSACTSVMIKVEANTGKPKYQAEIEFIPLEEWKNELWTWSNINNDQGKDDEKLSAVYGEEWRNIPPEKLMDPKYFKDIREFLDNKTKNLEFESADKLSKDLIKYTKTESCEEGGRMYWPLVKCVTVKVPNTPLLQHVTLVDLPGCGDSNTSRDKMWTEFVGSCSTVWIVTEINRAASEPEAWNILEDACSKIGNGGQCQQIHFICTKSEVPENWKVLSTDAVCACIFKRNMKTREEVQKNFKKNGSIQEHFKNECLQVFTVSSLEFQKGEQSLLQPDETEIPKLQEFLQKLNKCHSETLLYVSGAHGILSLMQGARSRDTADCKTQVCSQLDKKLHDELKKIRDTMDVTYEAFKTCLTEGVESSERSCQETLQKFLHPSKQKGSAFHKTLECVVRRHGVHTMKKGKRINLNADLSSKLTGSINAMFMNTFPNDGKSSFNEVISKFSLDTNSLIEKYSAVKLQLIFLKTEEQKLKTKLNIMIRERKKTVYKSLTETVEQALQPGYEKAAAFKGEDTLKKMRETLEKHVHDSKDTMFKKAKDVMLQNLKELMTDILKTLEETLKESIEKSLKSDHQPMSDISAELNQVKQYKEDLEASPDE